MDYVSLFLSLAAFAISAYLWRRLDNHEILIWTTPWKDAWYVQKRRTSAFIRRSPEVDTSSCHAPRCSSLDRPESAAGSTTDTAPNTPCRPADCLRDTTADIAAQPIIPTRSAEADRAVQPAN